MLPKFEYGHLYKFVVSVGLLVVALGVIIPWLVLSDLTALQVTEDELREFTPVARDAIETKQRQQRWLADYHLYISAVLVVCGGVLTGYGFAGWRARQSVLDETEDLQRDTVKMQLQKMDPQEVVEEREAEIALEAPPESTDVSYRQVLLSRYAEFEDLAVTRLGEALVDSHSVLRNVVLTYPGSRSVLDALLWGRDPDVPHLVVEVKYTTTAGAVDERVDLAVGTLWNTIDSITTSGERPAAGIAIIGVPDEVAGTPTVRRLGKGTSAGTVTHEATVLITTAAWLRNVEGPELRELLAPFANWST